MLKSLKKMLVTCAFPYSNGSIHLGHMLEHIQADIWVRYHKMQGNEVHFICSDDAHGTSIMLKAKELNVDPDMMIERMNQEHKKDFFDFSIDYDNYSSTHSLENKILTKKIYLKLKNNNFIKNKTIIQFYDSKEGLFLPDRFIRGICPKCKSTNQYGDHCECCGSIYDPIDLINPRSIISGEIPKIKKTEHFFFDLSLFSNMLRDWIHSGVLQKQVIKKILEWINSGLKMWDITRDFPYFGFKIPGELNKYFYVWLDASIGYISTFKNLCNKQKNIHFKSYWDKNSSTGLYHFIGKDIIYFHGLFWPSILEAVGYRKPTKIFVHGHLTINGKKMSKSKGTFITARSYLNYFESDYLRYYYATKLSSRIDDIDFNLEDFVKLVNGNLINKVVNLAARSVKFISKYFDCNLSSSFIPPKFYQRFILANIEIQKGFRDREYNRVIKEILFLADLANAYINEKKPWKIVHQKNRKQDLHEICSVSINLFRIIMIYLKPILPKLAILSEKFLNVSLCWKDISSPLLDHKITPFTILLNRINKNTIRNFLAEN